MKVLVVDDARFMRKAISDMLAADPILQVVGAARNGEEGLSMIKRLRPDVITLDMDMPVMDGLSAVRHIMIESPLPIVVLSSLFTDGAITFEALRLGVVDFVPKPSGAISRDIHVVQKHIVNRIKMAGSVHLDNIRRVRLLTAPHATGIPGGSNRPSLNFLLAIGTTLGGPNTVIRLLSQLPAELPAAVVVLQEISPQILEAFARQFDREVPWTIAVAEAGRRIEPGVCYIGSNTDPVGIQLDGSGRPCLVPAPADANPLDHLFSTAAEAFHHQTIGLLLSGVGDDGAAGFAKIREAAGVTIAQDTNCCVYPNLTGHAIAMGTVDIVLDEKKLPETIQTVMSN